MVTGVVDAATATREAIGLLMAGDRTALGAPDAPTPAARDAAPGAGAE